MAWTEPLDPENQVKDRIRIAVGDTVEDEPLLTDEWLDAKYLTITNEDQLAYLASLACAAHYAREVNTKVGPLQEEARVKWEHYMGMSKVLYNVWQGLAPDASGGSGIGTALIGWRSSQSRYPDPFFTRTKP